MIVAVIGLAPALCGSSAYAQKFDGCGVLVQGVECVLFKADSGGLWVLENRGNFKVGSRVHVVGELDLGCVTICQQERGCIRRNTIEECQPPINCDAIRKTKVKCKGPPGKFKVKAVIKSGLEQGTALTLTLDGQRDTRVVINRRGKGKAKWTHVAPGRHKVCVEECPHHCGSTDCT